MSHLAPPSKAQPRGLQRSQYSKSAMARYARTGHGQIATIGDLPPPECPRQIAPGKQPMATAILKIHDDDTLVIALQNLAAGDEVCCNGLEFALTENVP